MALPQSKLPAIFQDADVLEGAWRRVCWWYRGGEWAPEPEFAAWQLNYETLLRRLGRELASGEFTPQVMPLLPYAKKGGCLRHYCQPSVRDQTAFMVFGVLLAPVFEVAMRNCSFGNRWYRGLFRPLNAPNEPWRFRPWSLSDGRAYQPFRRAHGLFRRVASWTVDSMLHSSSEAIGPTGPRALPEDFAEEMIPRFARKQHWGNLPRIDRVHWAHFDLRYAFPSVRLDALGAAMHAMLDEVLPQPSNGRKKDFALAAQRLLLGESLVLYGRTVRQSIMDPGIARQLANYLCRCLRRVRYATFPGSDSMFFPEEETNPKKLPLGDGAEHPGLPTGLALSPLLLNIYLHGLDSEMSRWLEGSNKHRPGAFLRFADDMILLADSARLLAEGIDTLTASLGSQDGSLRDLNLRINWKKQKPDAVRAMVKDFKKEAHGRDISLHNWLEGEGNQHLHSLERGAVTVEAKDPFVTDLVEHLSELGNERETDTYGENALLRLTRLQEIIVFVPNDDAVPRETQLVFAANQLVRAWLPEENASMDAELLRNIRRGVLDALLHAPDRPKLWRSVVRAAVRRPILHGPKDTNSLQRDRRHASKWLHGVLGHFSVVSNGAWAKPPEENSSDCWPQKWSLLASFQRTAFWRALAEVACDLALHNVQLKQERSAFPSSASWLYRALDEMSLRESVEWLESEASEAINILYSSNRDAPLLDWETQALGLALLAFIPRANIAKRFGHHFRSNLEFPACVAEVLRNHSKRWQAAADLLAQAPTQGPQRATYPDLLWLGQPGGKADAQAAKLLGAYAKTGQDLLRLAERFSWVGMFETRIRAACLRELSGPLPWIHTTSRHDPLRVRQKLSDYARARRIWLGLGAGEV